MSGAIAHVPAAGQSTWLDYISRTLITSGRLALKVLATGGVYLGGGIAPAIPSVLRDGRFLKVFQRKGRFGDLLSHVPVHVIVCRAALIAVAIRGLESSALTEAIPGGETNEQ